MADRQDKLMEMQEIIFWQRLNGQLVELKQSNVSIEDDHHSQLRQFCLDNLLFSKVTQNPLIDDIPTSLVTDFQGATFITVNIKSWHECLSLIMPDLYILDVENALIESFDALIPYDRKYHLTRSVDADDADDDALYTFIRQYMKLKESQSMNFSQLALELHGMKADAIKQIMAATTGRFFPIQEGNIISLAIEDPIRNLAAEIYNEKLCKKGINLAEPIRPVLLDLELYGFLYKKREEENLKPSIQEFIDHELALCIRESELRQKFVHDANAKMSAENSNLFPICNILPFAFLDYPLPII